jgi:hypothetical protein
MSWFLLDHTDTLERENLIGLSMYKGKGKRELEKLPNCPICRKQVFLHSVKEIDNISFTGLRIGDAAWEYGMGFVVSERFIRHWQKDQLIGLEFSSEPVTTEIRSKTVFLNGCKKFYLTFPAPRIARLDKSAGAIYSDQPKCSVCMSSEVQSLEKLVFEANTVDGVDCCMPSCLPGWVLVSDRFRLFIEKHRLINFFFMEGFMRETNRKLIRYGHWAQLPNYGYTRTAIYADKDIQDVYKSWF